MCAGAIGWSQLSRIVWGADDPKRGQSDYLSRRAFHPRAEIVRGVIADEASALMRDFFAARRH